MNRYTVNGFTRIHKNKARAIWEKGGTVYACPCNLRPGAPWHPEAQLTPVPRMSWYTCDAIVNGLTLFTPETGRYLAYYVREEAGPQ